MGTASYGCCCKLLNCLNKFGAGEAIRTPDPNLGKVMLYPWATPAHHHILRCYEYDCQWRPALYDARWNELQQQNDKNFTENADFRIWWILTPIEPVLIQSYSYVFPVSPEFLKGNITQLMPIGVMFEFASLFKTSIYEYIMLVNWCRLTLNVSF